VDKYLCGRPRLRLQHSPTPIVCVKTFRAKFLSARNAWLDTINITSKYIKLFRQYIAASEQTNSHTTQSSERKKEKKCKRNLKQISAKAADTAKFFQQYRMNPQLRGGRRRACNGRLRVEKNLFGKYINISAVITALRHREWHWLQENLEKSRGWQQSR